MYSARTPRSVKRCQSFYFQPFAFCFPQHLLDGSRYLRHDGGGRVEDGGRGRGGRQPAADVLVPGGQCGDDDKCVRTWKTHSKSFGW